MVLELVASLAECGAGNGAAGGEASKSADAARRRLEAKELRVPLVSTVNNYADFFTKPLKSKAFFGLRNKIMNIA